MEVNRQHKDSVFSALFKEPDKLRELYSAIEGVTLSPETPIDINTLTDVLFMDQINDISFTVDNRLVILIEHQSTINPNMPLRLLLYVARVYERIIDRKTMYLSKLKKIPVPEFVVLYNGEDPYPDTAVLRLSDAFIDAKDLKIESASPAPLAHSTERHSRVSSENCGSPLDLTVKVYNINKGKNPEIVRKSKNLEGYSLFIATVREFTNGKSDDKREEAFAEAVKYCIDNGILADFLKEHSSEVINMLLTGWNWDEYVEVKNEEAVEQRNVEIAKKALAKGLPLDTIVDLTGLDTQTIQELAGYQMSI